jgi:hypothetical protein
MTVGRLSDYLVEQWLKTLSHSYLALHYDNPDVAGAYASEVFGAGYARQPVSMTIPSNRSSWNVTGIQFLGLPAITITHYALWDSLASGNYLAALELDAPIRVLSGKSLSLADHVVAISLD